MLIWRRSEVLLGMIKWDVGWRSDGNPEAGSARIFRWNNIEKASSPSESQQRDREGTVGVSAMLPFVCADGDGTAASR